MNTPNLPIYNPPAGRPNLQPGDVVTFTDDAPAPSGDVAAGARGIVLAAQLGGAIGTPGFLVVVTFSDGRDPVLCHEARLSPAEHGEHQTSRLGAPRERAVLCRQLGCSRMTWHHGGRCELHAVQHECAGLAMDPRTEAEARMWGATFGEAF